MLPSRSIVMAYCLCYVSVNSMQTFTVRATLLVRNFILETSKTQNRLGKDTKKCNSLKNDSVGYIVKIME